MFLQPTPVLHYHPYSFHQQHVLPYPTATQHVMWTSSPVNDFFSPARKRHDYQRLQLRGHRGQKEFKRREMKVKREAERERRKMRIEEQRLESKKKQVRQSHRRKKAKTKKIV